LLGVGQGTSIETAKERNMDYTTDEYWDCEHNYIHPKGVARCLVCGAEAEDQPDSIVAEVLEAGLPVAGDA